jgi:hypothetical protein
MHPKHYAQGCINKGWQRNFVPKKFRGIDSEWIPLFRGRKHSEARNGTELFGKKTKQPKLLQKMIFPYLKSSLF